MNNYRTKETHSIAHRLCVHVVSTWAYIIILSMTLPIVSHAKNAPCVASGLIHALLARPIYMYTTAEYSVFNFKIQYKIFLGGAYAPQTLPNCCCMCCCMLMTLGSTARPGTNPLRKKTKFNTPAIIQ